MKRLLCLLALLPALAFGQTKISQLPTVSSVKGTDVVPAYQSGSCSATGGTCGETLAQFTAYGFGLLSGDCTINVSTNVITCTKINGLTWPSLVSGDCLTNNGTTLSWGSCGSGSGTVTSFSFTNGGGINGSVATATTTPALSLTPSFTGLSYATSGTGFAAATASNVYGLWSGTCSSSTYLRGDGSCATPSGSGTINSALQYSLPYYSASGTASTLSGLNSPTSGPGYFTLRFDPTSGTAVAPTADQVGANVRSINGATSTDTVLYSDVLGLVVHDKAGSSSVNETLPTPTTLTNSHFAYNYCNNSSNTDTITPTTWTIAVNGGSAGSSISVGSGVCAQITVDPFNSNQWDAVTSGATSGGSSCPANIQVFTSTGSNTWTKPSSCGSNAPQLTRVILIGAGGGGGGGAMTASGTANSGGAGGGSGFFIEASFPTASLNSTETVTVGAGGTAGTGASTAGAGGAGGNGSATSFGTTPYFSAFGGGYGAGGQSGANSTGGGSAGSASGGNGPTGGGGAGGGGGIYANNGAGGTNGAAGSSANNSVIGPSGGASGGGVTTAPGVTNGGTGGNNAFTNSRPGGGSGSTGTAGNGSPGVAPSGGAYVPGVSGGGGGSTTTGTAGAGGTASYGDGGSGGGSCNTGGTCGAGSAGGNGEAIVITTY